MRFFVLLALTIGTLLSVLGERPWVPEGSIDCSQTGGVPVRQGNSYPCQVTDDAGPYHIQQIGRLDR